MRKILLILVFSRFVDFITRPVDAKRIFYSIPEDPCERLNDSYSKEVHSSQAGSSHFSLLFGHTTSPFEHWEDELGDQREPCVFRLRQDTANGSIFECQECRHPYVLVRDHYQNRSALKQATCVCPSEATLGRQIYGAMVRHRDEIPDLYYSVNVLGVGNTRCNITNCLRCGNTVQRGVWFNGSRPIVETCVACMHGYILPNDRETCLETGLFTRSPGYETGVVKPRCSDHCVECVTPDICEICENFYHAVETIRGTSCASLCPRGTFGHRSGTGLDLKCERCSNECMDCVEEPRYCTECREGFFEFEDDHEMFIRGQRAMRCVLWCPDGYYHTKTYPFRCLRCQAPCLGCSGPTRYDCDECQGIGVVGERTEMVECLRMSRILLGHRYRARRTLLLVNGSFREQYMPELKLLGLKMTGRLFPMGERDLHRPWAPNQVHAYYSAHFEDWAQADQYFGKRPLDSRYWPQCDSDTCQDNCLAANRTSACPGCRKNFTTTPWQTCRAQCPSRMFKDRLSDRCSVCPRTSTCAACEMIWTIDEENHPNEEMYDNGPTRINCLNYTQGAAHWCRDVKLFRDLDGFCMACHSSCNGCTGPSATHCINCKHFRREDGQCVKRCGPNEYAAVVYGVKVCRVITGNGDKEENAYNVFKRSYWQSCLVWLVPEVFLVVHLLAFALAIFLFYRRTPPDGRDDNRMILNWRNEEAIYVANARYITTVEVWKKRRIEGLNERQAFYGKEEEHMIVRGRMPFRRRLTTHKLWRGAKKAAKETLGSLTRSIEARTPKHDELDVRTARSSDTKTCRSGGSGGSGASGKLRTGKSTVSRYSIREL